MFTIADIRNIAIQIEHNGEATYRNAAKAASDPDIADVFNQMAEDEKRHAQWFESIEANRELTEEQREMEAVGKTILQEMVKDKTFSLEKGELDDVDTLHELVNKSLGFEQDTILFYEMLSGFIDDEDTLQQLKEIIAEEKRHFEELGNLSQSDGERLLGTT